MKVVVYIKVIVCFLPLILFTIGMFLSVCVCTKLLIPEIIRQLVDGRTDAASELVGACTVVNRSM